VADGGSIRARLARPFDPAELRRIKRLWVRHSTAEDRRDTRASWPRLPRTVSFPGTRRPGASAARGSGWDEGSRAH